jgi:hypothetical protein
MPAAEARVQTGDAGRYLIRLCQHVGKMRSHLGYWRRSHSDGGAPPEIRSAEWSDTSGIVVLSLGQCTLRAADGTLTIRAEASTPENLTRMQELISRRLESFGRRERLMVTWQPALDRPGGPEGEAVSGTAASDADGVPR